MSLKLFCINSNTLLLRLSPEGIFKRILFTADQIWRRRNRNCKETIKQMVGIINNSFLYFSRKILERFRDIISLLWIVGLLILTYVIDEWRYIFFSCLHFYTLILVLGQNYIEQIFMNWEVLIIHRTTIIFLMKYNQSPECFLKLLMSPWSIVYLFIKYSS